MTPEREAEIRELAARFTAPGSKHPLIGAILTELFAELDAARRTVSTWGEPGADPLGDILEAAERARAEGP